MKKLMKSVALVAFAAATLSIVGCGAATPEKVAVDFVEKIYQKGDFEGAAKLCTKKTAPLISLMASMAKDDKSFKKESPTGAWLTRDADVVKRYKKDSLCNYTFTVNGYYNMFELLGRVSDKNWAKKLKKDMPVLIISGKDDPVGNFGKGVLNVYERMKDAGMTDVKCKLYEGARHEPFNELESVRNEAYADVEAFINKVISARR